ncbi:hypothetical protein [Smaragdicoccus niigatensis]|uniref:hypothetical protein n=1 Tax=Smaragdicoccus niigatensis TaxID=359359 RepID=UPI00039BE14B|nr:hypothetical protein [Smaragdicoccus niigatensis]
MNANTATDESLHVFGYIFGTTPAGGFLLGALVGAVALAGIALIASRLAGSAGRRNSSRQVEAERAALTEKHHKELTVLNAQAEEDRAALIEEHETDLARHRQEAETQRVTLAEQHQRELDRQSKEAEAERAELMRHHGEQLALGKQAVRDALERALGSSGELVADKPEKLETETLDTEKSDTEKSDTEKSDTEESNAESWERAFGDKTDVDVTDIDESNDDKTDVDETRDEKVEPLGWHHEVDTPHEGNGHRTGRHRESGETENGAAPHKSLWQRVVSAVDQRRHE